MTNQELVVRAKELYDSIEEPMDFWECVDVVRTEQPPTRYTRANYLKKYGGCSL